MNLLWLDGCCACAPFSRWRVVLVQSSLKVDTLSLLAIVAFSSLNAMFLKRDDDGFFCAMDLQVEYSKDLCMP